jgi:hypothetical protein
LTFNREYVQLNIMDVNTLAGTHWDVAKNANKVRRNKLLRRLGLRHSVRNALSGSTCVARRAGKKQASIAAAASRAPDITKANGSLGLT